MQTTMGFHLLRWTKRPAGPLRAQVKVDHQYAGFCLYLCALVSGASSQRRRARRQISEELKEGAARECHNSLPEDR